MLDLDDILRYYPERLKEQKFAIYREYLQYLILDAVFKSKFSSRLSFLGGTALRIIYNNQRFSEDIDFDYFGITYSEFNELGDVIKTSLEKQGFTIEIKFIKKEAFHCYIKFPGVMHKYGLSPLPDQKVLIQLDAAAHGFAYQPEPKLLNRFGILTEVFVTPIDILLAQKFWALLNRKRAKGRDYFDIVFLLGLTKPNYEYLQFKAGINSPAALKRRVLAYIAELNFNYLQKDVAPFVFTDDGTKAVSKFKEIIRSAV